VQGVQERLVLCRGRADAKPVRRGQLQSCHQSDERQRMHGHAGGVFQPQWQHGTDTVHTGHKKRGRAAGGVCDV